MKAVLLANDPRGGVWLVTGHQGATIADTTSTKGSACSSGGGSAIPMAPVRALFAIPDMDRGGPQTVFAQLLRSLDRSVVTPALAVSYADGAHIKDLPAELVTHSLPQRRYPALPAARLVRAVRPDVVLSTLRMNFTFLGARPLLPRGTAWVVRQANHVSADLRNQRATRQQRSAAVDAAYKRMMHAADLVVCQSDPMAQDVAARYGQDVADKCRVIPNPIDVDRAAQRAAQEAEQDPRPGNPTLVTMGRLSYQKGYDLLFDAMPDILSCYPDTRLWVLGDGEEREVLVDKAKAQHFDHAVEFLGSVANPHPLLAKADLYVCSSRYEGFSNALLESLASGTPVVAPRGPAAGEAIVDSHTGWLYGQATADSIAEAVSKALAELPRLEDPGALRASCERRFSPGTVASAYADVLIEASEARS